jgi:hypothetical protein
MTIEIFSRYAVRDLKRSDSRKILGFDKKESVDVMRWFVFLKNNIQASPCCIGILAVTVREAFLATK